MTLKNILIDKLSSGKKLSFREFMQIALYYPEFGYYASNKEKISAQGDFITATSQTSLFARTFARQFSLVISHIGTNCNVIEFGAGQGKFAADCMAELESLESLPYKYIIIELSNDLKQRQQEYIKNNIPHLYNKFIWLNELPKEKIKAVVFANEVLDAMPVDIFKAKNGKLIQQGVSLVDNEFEFTDLDSNDKRFEYEVGRILEDNLSFEDGYTSEINTWIRPWVKSLKDTLLQGVVFLCDYGYHRALYYSKERNMGTLTCYYQHKVNFDPFINIGEQDVTAHVDFTTVAESVVENGFELDGYITQANFLKRANISQVFLDVSKRLESAEQLKYNKDMKELVLNDKLAEIFKVFAFSVEFAPVLDVFDNKDNIDYLL
ncbi:hypothetical protein LO80_08180 [Candidatus Francisella endociliophora]|uniref:SAM-dependent methyltransferase n=1 Tax=Candidatus Francisella endociliophora TaxID=653937 RepID=A0A097ERY5_9GAMM|nr:SAM-dependent methyltransferase [Francisella sp. FSC1006]AIT10331.1 hypothetical protein LO80_08180 [Francisella sp. FSC1006]